MYNGTSGVSARPLKTLQILVPLRGFEPLTPSLRTRGTIGKLRFLWRFLYLFAQYVLILFAFRRLFWYICTSGRERIAVRSQPSPRNALGVRHGCN